MPVRAVASTYGKFFLRLWRTRRFFKFIGPACNWPARDFGEWGERELPATGGKRRQNQHLTNMTTSTAISEPPTCMRTDSLGSFIAEYRSTGGLPPLLGGALLVPGLLIGGAGVSTLSSTGRNGESMASFGFFLLLKCFVYQ